MADTHTHTKYHNPLVHTPRVNYLEVKHNMVHYIIEYICTVFTSMEKGRQLAESAYWYTSNVSDLV